jgi:hypothetical protein
MKSWDRAVATHLQIVDKFLEISGIESGTASVLKNELLRYMNTRLNRGFWLHPEITRFHTEWYRELYRVTGLSDPYLEIKNRSNGFASKIISQITIRNLREAVNASIVGNRLDFGVFHYDPEKLPVAVEDFSNLPGLPFLYDDYPELESAIRNAASIAYITDNHGEILFDGVVVDKIKAMKPDCRIYLAGKASPMLNDVTADELLQLGFRDKCHVVSTGSNCFGVPVDEISNEFLNILQSADVIIAKGQALFEFWIEYNYPKVFNLLYTKIPVLDPLLGEIPSGGNIIISSKNYALEGKKTDFENLACNEKAN